MKRNLHKSRLACLFAGLLLLQLILALPVAADSEPPVTSKVLILNSYHKGMEWTDEETEGITNRIKEVRGYTTLYTEYMDWKRYPNETNIRHFYERVKAKYEGVKFDLVITTDDMALEFALEHRDDLLGNAPIVFCGVNEVSAERLTKGQHGVTGVLETLEPGGTLKAALQLNPNLKKVYVLFDNSESGISTGRIVMEKIRSDFPGLTGIPMNQLTREQILDLAGTLMKDSIFLMTTYFQDSSGKTMEFDAFSKELSTKSRVPVYHLFNFGLNNGGIGGSLASGTLQGEEAANLGLLILNGERVDNIPFYAADTTRLAFDYNELKRFSIPFNRLPKDSEVINRPFSFYRTYRSLVIGTAAAFAVLILFIAILIFYVDQVRRIRKKLEQSNERFSLATYGSAAVIWDMDMLSQRYYFSDIWYELLGYERGDLNEEFGGWRTIIHPDDVQAEAKNKREHMSGEKPYYFCEYRLLTKSGSYKWFQVRGMVLRDAQGAPIRFAGSMTDVTDRKDFEVKLQDSYQELESTYEELTAVQAELLEQYNRLVENQTMLIQSEEKYRELAYNDTLSGLPNKRSLVETLARFTEENKRAAAALLFLDIDNFKYINDTMGHSFGDQLLAAFSSRLISLSGPNDEHFRFGGDEYVIFLKDIQSKKEVLDYAERMIEAVKEPFSLHDSLLHVSVSIGIACYPDNGTTVEELLQKADVAMYRAKQAGRGVYALYEQEMQQVFDERMRIERHLREALQKDELLLYYQPITVIGNDQIWGFEALLRWNSPELGFVSPFQFIEIAEDCRLIIPIGEWVLTSACRFITSVHERGNKDCRISVNISLIQLMQDDFNEMVVRVLDQTGLTPSMLQIEITESVLMKSFGAIISKLEFLRGLGVSIALDDFGTGYSSLSYLKQLPITTLKIDKSFISGLREEKAGESLAESIVSIGHNLGIEVTAEGVETREQLEDLKRMNCDKIQGYYISRPIPEEEVHNWLLVNSAFHDGTQAG
ncbi:EAL domain-containing protein [Gorillibacterium timonense]|uniref:EAL domain-containing protein n=1 Tax=Gorillibacterium timonense TaxID=1689269 RepID=UPI000A72D7DF|nr:EAL domain-containing protein [Gorillibacterium timonense]